MSNEEEAAAATANVDEEADSASLGYKPPAEKSLGDIINTDAEDEALQKYKAALLGSAAGGKAIEVEPGNPNNVIVKKLALVVEGRPDMELDLTGDLKAIKKTVLYKAIAEVKRESLTANFFLQTFAIKEGIQFRIRIDFFVQREIVNGLKYVQKTSRKGVPGKS